MIKGNYSPSRKNKAVSKNNRASGFRAFMTNRFGLDLTCSRVNDSHFFVFARRDKFRSIPIEASAEDNVGVAVYMDQDLAGSDVPNHHLIVRSSGKKNIERGRMPNHETYSALVIEQVHNWFSEGSSQSTIGNLPHLTVNNMSGRRKKTN